MSSSLAAQDGTADALARASRAYEQLDVEGALAILRRIISPSWTADVAPAQRTQAYLYLGACLALGGKTDSAAQYFRAAVASDPFTQLDPARFTPAQVELFVAARRATFRVAVRPVHAERIDPRTGRLRFKVVSTRATTAGAVVRAVGGAGQDTLFQGTLEGIREIAWDGLLSDGKLAPPGRYEFVVAGSIAAPARADSARVFFVLAHETATLADTLPPLGPGDLLPERQPSGSAAGELAKGLAVAAFAALIAGGFANDDLGESLGGGAAVVAGAAVVTGVVAFLASRGHATMPENVAANERRRAERAARNAAIRDSNAAKIAATVLVVTPAAGVGP